MVRRWRKHIFQQMSVWRTQIPIGNRLIKLECNVIQLISCSRYPAVHLKLRISLLLVSQLVISHLFGQKYLTTTSTANAKGMSWFHGFKIQSDLLRWIKNPDDPILEQTVMYEFGTDACNVASSLNETHFTFDGMLNGQNGDANDVISRINKVEVPFRTCS